MRSECFSRNTTGSANPIDVGGVTPLTTIDYPHHLAAVLFLRGCPWRCGYCHNAGLLKPDPSASLPWQDIVAFLEQRRQLLDAVVFSGGEPTLQSGLGEAMRQVRSIGFRVGLHTAGIYPGRLAAVLPLVDWVGLDIKSARADYHRVTGARHSARRAWHSLELILASGVEHEFRTTVHPDLLHADRLDNLFHELAEAGARRVAVQACNQENCRDPSLRKGRNPFPATGFFDRYATWFESFELRAESAPSGPDPARDR